MEQCLELNNRFCVRCLKCISAPILEFSLGFKSEIGARGKGCELPECLVTKAMGVGEVTTEDEEGELPEDRTQSL